MSAAIAIIKKNEFPQEAVSEPDLLVKSINCEVKNHVRNHDNVVVDSGLDSDTNNDENDTKAKLKLKGLTRIKTSSCSLPVSDDEGTSEEENTTSRLRSSSLSLEAENPKSRPKSKSFVSFSKRRGSSRGSRLSGNFDSVSFAWNVATDWGSSNKTCFQTIEKFRDVGYFEVKKYGIVGQSIFLVSDPRVIREFLHDRETKGNFAPINRPAQMYQNTLQNSGSHDIYWKLLRKKMIQFMATSLPKCSDQLVNDFKIALKEWQEQEGKIDLHISILKTVIIGQVKAFFGVPLRNMYDKKKRTKCSFVEVVDKMVNKVLVDKATDGEVEFFHEEIKHLVSIAKENTLIATLKEVVSEDEKFQNANLVEQNARMFVCAVTPAYGIFWSLMCLIRNPHALQRCVEAQNDDTFVQKCVKEAFRLFPPVPVMLERKPAQKHTFKNNMSVPKGSLVVCGGIWALTDEKFDPVRWNDDECKLISSPIFSDPNKCPFANKEEKVIGPTEEKEEKIIDPTEEKRCPFNEHEKNNTDFTKPSYFPFGAGDHQCMGRFYASKMVVQVVKYMVQNAVFELENDFLNNKPVPLQRSNYMGAYHRPPDGVYAFVSSI